MQEQKRRRAELQPEEEFHRLRLNAVTQEVAITTAKTSLSSPCRLGQLSCKVFDESVEDAKRPGLRVSAAVPR